MRIRKHLSYANVAATLALVFSLAGGAYAVTKVGSHDIVNNSIKSRDVKNSKGVKGADVVRDSLRGRQVRESSLDAFSFAPVAGNEAGDCDPSGPSLTECAATTLRLRERSRVLAIATGGQESVSAPASAHCEVQFDHRAEPVSVDPGEATASNTSASATNGFARTSLSQHLLSKGSHRVTLACSQLTGDVRIDAPTIAAIAIGSR